MSRVTAPPFRRPLRERISLGPWFVGPVGHEVESPGTVEHWDYATLVGVRTLIRAEISEIRVDCGLDGSAQLDAVIRWQSTWTNLRGCTNPVRLKGDEALIGGSVPGQLLGGNLRLEAVVILAQPGAGTNLSPRRAGSVLWRSGVSLPLEGVAARFPTQVMDFDKAGIAGGIRGAWLLVWNAEHLEVPALGGLRLLLNSAHPTIERLIAEGPAKPDLRAVQSALRHDVRRQMVLGAIGNPDFDRDDDYGEGTLGSALQGILDVTFGDEGLDSIRGLHQKNPSEFEARLQAKSGLFWPDAT
jgi:hypothetical protein